MLWQYAYTISTSGHVCEGHRHCLAAAPSLACSVGSCHLQWQGAGPATGQARVMQQLSGTLIYTSLHA